jgi:ABC-2 type transport system ATP-binding protein
MATALPPALEAEGLSKSYGDLRAVDSFSVRVDPGIVLGFLGPNGAGKTTVIRMLSTVLPPDAGSFTVAGVPHTQPMEIRRRTGVLPESAGYPQGQTGEEWLTYHARLFGQNRDDAHATARRLLAEVGLADRAGSLIGTYSRGMRQRLGIARALVNEPRVVFLDEPTLGLDPIGQRQVLDLVTGIARGRGVTVVLSTHVLAEVEQSCDRVLILNRGRVVAEGTVAEVSRTAAAPRLAVVRVPAEMQDQAVDVFRGGEIRAETNGYRLGELALTVPADVSPEAASAQVLTTLMTVGVPVLEFRLEGGRLSDAFLAVTAEEASV